jgi:hypothetical protein
MSEKRTWECSSDVGVGVWELGVEAEKRIATPIEIDSARRRITAPRPDRTAMRLVARVSHPS